MTYNDSCILSDCPHLNVVEYEYGFYIELDYTLGQENVLFDLWLYGLSQALIRVLVDAYKELDCRFIRFAADDPQYDRYTLHDW